MADKFEKFTERARKVFSLAQEEAQRLNHNYIGTEHLLLGLVREGDGIAARVLANLGVQLPQVRQSVKAMIGRGDGEVIGDPGLTPRAKKVIELAMDEARRLNNHYIGTEHLLLGLVREGEGIAAITLTSLGVSLETVRQQVMQVVSSSANYQQSEAAPSPPMEVRFNARFTERTRRIFALAQEEAARFNHNYIGTEHLLLGLVREGDGVAARALTDLGVQLSKVRSAVEFIIGRGDGLISGDPGLTPRSKKVIELAMDEAHRLGNAAVGSEHLLLGLVREGEGIAAGVLESLGVSLERVRQQVMQMLGNPARAPLAPPTASSSTKVGAGDFVYGLTLPGEVVEHLVRIAQERGQSLDALILDAIARTWMPPDTAATDAPIAAETLAPSDDSPDATPDET